MKPWHPPCYTLAAVIAAARMSCSRGRREEHVTTATSRAAAAASTARLPVAAAIFLMGTAFVFLAGFAQPELLHNAAHDIRHAMPFPCH
jgi:cobalt transporter subunit CbtB